MLLDRSRAHLSAPYAGVVAYTITEVLRQHASAVVEIHPGAEAREPQKTFVGRPLDVCKVREPAANLSVKFV